MGVETLSGSKSVVAAYPLEFVAVSFNAHQWTSFAVAKPSLAARESFADFLKREGRTPTCQTQLAR